VETQTGTLEISGALSVRKCLEYGNPYCNFRFSRTGSWEPVLQVPETWEYGNWQKCCNVFMHKITAQVMIRIMMRYD